MRADRLLSIMLLLQTRAQVPASELAERLEVSVRTIYRDVEALSAAGVPVWASRGRSGGIALLPGFRTDLTGLNSDEARALFVLATEGTHDALGLGSAMASALRKVMAALPAPHRPPAEQVSSRVLVDPARWMREPAAKVELVDLQEAVFTDRRLAMTYRHASPRPGDDPAEPNAKTYVVDPYGLVSKAGVWYLVADLDGAPRLFRADRVLSSEVTDQAVRRRAELTLAEAWAELRDGVERVPDAVTVEVRVHRRRLGLFLRLNSACLHGPPVPVDDSWLAATLGFRALPAVRGLLAFGADVEVLTPPEARTLLADTAAEVTALYTG
ncbi:YafY family protein [Actinocorallia lasiicapitis]